MYSSLAIYVKDNGGGGAGSAVGMGVCWGLGICVNNGGVGSSSVVDDVISIAKHLRSTSDIDLLWKIIV